MKGVRIEKLREQHLPQVMEIERGSFATPWSLQSFLPEITNPLACPLVAVEATRVVGYIVARRLLDEGYIFKLAVLEERRRQGLGSKLTDAALAWLREGKCREVWLEVRESNKAAREFYSKFGFRVRGLRKRYYGPSGEDAIVLSLTL